jgi:hypothetical protein
MRYVCSKSYYVPLQTRWQWHCHLSFPILTWTRRKMTQHVSVKACSTDADLPLACAHPQKILEANAISECEDECSRCAVVGGTICSCALPNNVGIVIVKMNCCGCISLVNRKGRRTMRNGSGSLDNNYGFLLPPPPHTVSESYKTALISYVSKTALLAYLRLGQVAT